MSKSATPKKRRAKKRVIPPGLFGEATASRSRAIAKAFRAGRLDEARRLVKEKS
ncbi:MAG: hypothetical protein KGJ74_07150 [Betaproteobacteria bacterium]|jgi:hypothetical protein|nr:hypothetical protein [Betaproteobacteria bacterium]